MCGSAYHMERIHNMSKTTSVLVVEDDKYIANFISMSLQQENYQVERAQTGQEALALYYGSQPDILILDLGLPDMDGMSIISEIRNYSERPIIVVSARQGENEKIRVLDAGADDYVVKPFHMGELMARIRVAERKMSAESMREQEPVFECDYLKIDYEKRKVIVEGEEVHVTPIEYKLLCLLVQNRGKVLTHNYILQKIWGYEEGTDPGSIRVFMTTLRRKIEKDTTHPRFIITEVGVGYRFAEE